MNNETNNELKEAVQKIADWEMPKTGKYWDNEKTQEMSYAACYGTQGEQLIIQDYAQNALTILSGYDHAAAEMRERLIAKIVAVRDSPPTVIDESSMRMAGWTAACTLIIDAILDTNPADPDAGKVGDMGNYEPSN